MGHTTPWLVAAVLVALPVLLCGSVAAAPAEAETRPRWTNPGVEVSAVGQFRSFTVGSVPRCDAATVVVPERAVSGWPLLPPGIAPLAVEWCLETESSGASSFAFEFTEYPLQARLDDALARS